MQYRITWQASQYDFSYEVDVEADSQDQAVDKLHSLLSPYEHIIHTLDGGPDIHTGIFYEIPKVEIWNMIRKIDVLSAAS